ncbi:MAG: ATP-binding protein [Kofleriaceae bacterium]|nr:ATP-binding protein [Kofleriaceae bacterium]MBP9172451.1 ATP-binding protein [Kofleriaceae bacterium]MBP9860577.1 ATP-binding protein [Kofleriaceae bacterium]
MTDMLRTVPTGDLGLDVLLGGGWRLVKRLGDAESTTVVVRGGSGAGKTLLGIHVALELARALGGDVVVGCVEILPTEYIAQLQSARPSLPAERIALLPKAASTADGPRVYVGLMLDLDPEQPDLNASLATLREATATAGGKPVVFLVDSLIEGYGIGSSAPRIAVDDCMKFAAKHGVGLVLCEEIVSDAPSPWVFAADTVLQVGVESRERGRWIEVKKHRFGPSATGRHELELVGHEPHPVAFPEVAAWRLPWLKDVLTQHGYCEAEDKRSTQHLRWQSAPDVIGALVLVSGQRRDLVRKLAEGLSTDQSKRPFTIQFDPLVHSVDGWSQVQAVGLFAPTSFGAPRAVRYLVEVLRSAFRETQLTVDRILVGDAALVLSGDAATDWVIAIETLCGIVIDRGWGLPIVVYDGDAEVGGAARRRLAASADVVAKVSSRVDSVTNRVKVTIRNRWSHLDNAYEVPLPPEVDRSPRPAGRS